MRYRPRLLLLAIPMLGVVWSLPAQERPIRRRFLDPSTPTSDDPRRVPMPAERGQVHGTIVLRGGRVFDGSGAPPSPLTVVITRNVITALLPAGKIDWPADAKVMDVTGKTVLPGLIDLHTHLTYTDVGVSETRADHDGDAALRGAERLRYWIESGVTSVRDVASHGEVPFILKEWVSAGRIPGPRVFAAGKLITGTGGHGAEAELPSIARPWRAIRQASGPDDWREAVREQVRAGADVIKVASHFSKEEIEAAVQEAHELGLKVCADAETFYIQRAVEAGVDVIEHPLPRSDETIRLMAQRGTQADPTLVPYEIIFDNSGGYFGATSRRFTFSKAANLEMLRRLKVAGVTLGIGTDLVFDWFRYMPNAYLTEMHRFMDVGFTAREVLSIATKTNAKILDMDDKLGTLEAGKLADILVVDGRPDEHIDDLAKVDVVIRDGRLVVERGQVIIPRHEAKPMPTPKTN